MKRFIKNIILLSLTAPALTACLEEAYPGRGFTQEQLFETDNTAAALSKAIPGAMLRMGNGNGHYGYAGLFMDRETMCAEIPVYDMLYDYYQDEGFDRNYSPEFYMATDWWPFYYELIKKANLTVGAVAINENTSTEELAHVGNALGYRAFAYYDMAFAYEYKKTGIAKLDNEAAANKVYGLTTQLVTEKTSETDARNNPRVPFQTMYKYILDELETAGNLLNGFTRSAKNLPNSAVVAGLKARTWLELGSRFEKYPADLAAFTAVRSDITSAKDCYAKAAQFAREAITASGAQPLTESDWFGGKSYTTGFNSILASSWMWGIITKEANVYSSYINFASNMCPEQTFGVANATYGATRTISKALFDQIPDADWRKASWIAPGDAGKAPGSKYRTLLTDDDFKTLAPYAGLKFKPNEGNMIDYKVGAAMD